MKKGVLLSTVGAVISLSIPMTTVFASTSITSNTTAVDGQNHDQQIESVKSQINTIMEEMSIERAEALLPSSTNGPMAGTSSSNDSATLSTELQNQTAELKSLGVTPISASQVQSIQAASKGSLSATPQVVTPPSTSDVNWYSYTYTFYDGGNGKTYDVQELYAQGLNASSNLGYGGDGVHFDSKTWTLQTLENEGINLASIYAGKLIGSALEHVPVVGWLPWELIMPQPPSGSTIDDENTTYRGLETVCFAYVKPDGSSTSQTLSFISNMVSVSSVFNFAGFNGNGKSYVYPSSPKENSPTYAQYYADATSEVTAYEDYPYAQSRSWVESFGFHNPDNSQSFSVTLTEPSFPAQVS